METVFRYTIANHPLLILINAFDTPDPLPCFRINNEHLRVADVYVAIKNNDVINLYLNVLCI